MTFGAFISTRRKEAKLNLRDTAKHLGISNGYLCDIEQGRRPAPEGAFVERISSFLELDKQEHEMLLDLAADSRQTVPADLPDYIRQHEVPGVARGGNGAFIRAFDCFKFRGVGLDTAPAGSGS